MNPSDRPLPPKAFIRADDKPSRVAAWTVFWVAMAFAVIALPFVVILLGEDRPEAGAALWEFSMGCGFAAWAMVLLQFAMTSRIRWITAPFGADILYVVHRIASWGVLALALLHFGVLYIWYEPALGALNPLKAPWELTIARLALVCFGLLILTSELRKRLNLPYRAWRLIHIALGTVGTAAALLHMLGVGNYTEMAGSRALWLGIFAGWIVFMLWSRMVRPFLLARHPWRVISNEVERGGVHTLTLRPEGAPLRGWKPGQFAWLSLGHAPWKLRDHPFTISTAPDRGPEISFSIKPLGDDSEQMAKAAPGTVAYVEGPYGTFSIDREAKAEGFVMIAGGVGITPILANLHALHSRNDPRPVILIYANSTLEEASFREELEEIAKDNSLTIVHVPEEAPEDWQGETGRIDKALLARHLPDITRAWPHMLCGPTPLIAAATKALISMGTPAHQVTSEVFDMV